MGILCKRFRNWVWFVGFDMVDKFWGMWKFGRERLGIGNVDKLVDKWIRWKGVIWGGVSFDFEVSI